MFRSVNTDCKEEETLVGVAVHHPRISLHLSDYIMSGSVNYVSRTQLPIAYRCTLSVLADILSKSAVKENNQYECSTVKYS